MCVCEIEREISWYVSSRPQKETPLSPAHNPSISQHDTTRHDTTWQVVFLTDVDGVFDKSPELPGASLICQILVLVISVCVCIRECVCVVG